MGSVTSRNGRLIIDFRYQGIRCRERTQYVDTVANKAIVEAILKKIEAELILGTFEYAKYFPMSKRVKKFEEINAQKKSQRVNVPLFCNFVPVWFNENKSKWRISHQTSVTNNLQNHLIKEFGGKVMSEITKSDYLNFRTMLAQPDDEDLYAYSEATINKITNVMRMIMTEASDRFGFKNPMVAIKNLKVRKFHIEPFSLNEVMLFIKNVRHDYRNYYTVRFFTGMRTGEIDGLQWKYVDFDNRLIMIRETLVTGRIEYTKTDSSQREILMTDMVYKALKEQHKSNQ